jgi:adenylate cyclase
MPDSRQLAVIMFSDIVGYTAMMQHDESRALAVLNRFRDQMNGVVPQYHGEVVQYYGDGVLTMFTNSFDAINCARVLQESFREEPPVPVRMGIHMGDVIYKDGNVFGDAVNIASRIQSMAVPGSVMLSAAVQFQLKNKPECKLASLGDFEFKNIDDPMEIFALSGNGFPVPQREELHGKFKEKEDFKSIAVLPFVNMSNDPEQEYFSDGMAEEIINSLTHLKELHVAGRTSSFQFKGKSIDLREVGKKLAVRTVLEGSVRKQGNRIRITAQLIDVDNGYHLWSEKYDREINDLFAIQDEIALAITEKLLISLLQTDRDRITKPCTQSTEAYELFLKGRFFQSRRGTSLLTSIECFKKAIAIDPDFALAHATLADAFLLLATYGLVPPGQVMASAKKYAEQAQKLDPGLSQPYCSLGYYYTCYEWNWGEGKKNFLKSLELNPRYAEGHFRYGWNYLACVEGKFEQAEKHGKIALQLEPLSSICYATHSLILHGAGKFEEALSVCKNGIELDAQSFVCQLNAGRTQLELKQYEEAVLSYEMAIKLSNRHHFTLNGLIWTYCINGAYDKARALMNELKERSAKEYISKTVAGMSSAYLGDLDEAFDYLETAINDREPILLMLKYDRLVPPALRDDYRFKNILERIGFPV